MSDTNDKELLEMAAKAAGIEGEYESWTGQGFKEGIRQMLNGAKCQRPWNPLTDDGDALRLAVKLNLMIDVIEGFSGAQALNVAFCSEHHSIDPYASTRRAIVRAAAEIGKATS